MINTIGKLKSITDGDLRRLKSIQSALNKIQSLIKKDDYISALRISKGKLRSLLPEPYPDSITILDELDMKIKDQIRQFKINFDRELVSMCEKSVLTPISGDNRKGFRIKGIIELSIDFENGKSTVGTYSKNTKINSVELKDIINEIDKLNRRLFERKWIADDFLKELYEAYLVVSKGLLDKEVPLRDVQTQLWLKSQSDSFWKSFNNDRLNNYPTDEFSVDLNKLLRSKYQISNDLDYILSEGAGGVIVYDNSGHIRSFKFLTFRKRRDL